VIIWDFETRAPYAKLVLHRNAVQAVSFTYNDKYLVSLGGQDDARCQQRHSIIIIIITIILFAQLCRPTVQKQK